MENILSILESRHHCYDYDLLEKYRLTYSRSSEFKLRYLKKHYEEDPQAWDDRKAITYTPSFAAEAVDEYVRAIVQRARDINRVGGRLAYRQICDGEERGIDLQGSTMNAFMSQNVVPELLAMGRVGVYVDNASNLGVTLQDAKGKHPYVYTYRAENILNWRFDTENPNELVAVLLRDYVETSNSFNLPDEVVTRYRIVTKVGNKVMIRFFDEKGTEIKTVTQNTRFPFILAKIAHSLLKVTADIQISLLNLCSSDMYYAWASNFPIYTEQYDPLDWSRLKETRTRVEDLPQPSPIGAIDQTTDTTSYASMPPGPATGGEQKIKVGIMHGRKYPLNAERPGFIHPSPEPLQVSMQKEDQLKREIRQLTALAITQLEPQVQASAESRAMDNLGLEAGMALIAQELEGVENKISSIFHSYYRDDKPTRAKYPEKYNLKTDEDRREEAKQLLELHQAVPSRIYQNNISKNIVMVMFKDKVPAAELEQMFKEIEASPVPTADPDILRSDHEAGLVSDKTASMGRGYGPEEWLKAREDHAERAKRVAAAQATVKGDPGSRGNDDLSNDPDAAKKEKEAHQDPNMDKDGRGTEGVKPKEPKS